MCIHISIHINSNVYSPKGVYIYITTSPKTIHKHKYCDVFIGIFFMYRETVKNERGY